MFNWDNFLVDLEMKSTDKEKFDRKQRKTKKIMGFVIAPILLMIAGLLALGILDFEEGVVLDFEEILEPNYVDIISEVDVHCYNVNWFGQFGFQIVYQESIVEIAEKLGEYDVDFTASEFYENQAVVDYLVLECPHIDSKLDAPAEYDANIGIDAYPKCLERKIGELNYKEFCSKFVQ